MFPKHFQVDSFILISALRYALPRTTYANKAVVENILHNIDFLDTEEIEKIIVEIGDHATRFGWKMDCDKWVWMDLVIELDKELEKRGVVLYD